MTDEERKWRAETPEEQPQPEDNAWEAKETEETPAEETEPAQSAPAEEPFTGEAGGEGEIFPPEDPLPETPPEELPGWGAPVPEQMPGQPPQGWAQAPTQQGFPGYGAWGAQPAQGQPTAWQQPVQPGAGGYAPFPPKKKMSKGLLAFIIAACVLSAGALLGFGGYVAYHAVRGQDAVEWVEEYREEFPFDQLPFGGNEEDGSRGKHQRPGRTPEDGQDDREEDPEDDGQPEKQEETPNFGVTPPDVDDPQPQIDTTPTGETVVLHQPTGQALDPQEVYEKVVDSTVTVASTRESGSLVQTGVGTGIVATEDGYILTNSHVVLHSKSTRVKIITSDGVEHDAVVVGVDKTTDLAVLKTDAAGLTPAEFGDSDLLAIGQTVFAIGNPGGVKYSGSLTGGYISGLNRAAGRYSENGMTYIQTDAAINPGNSGGPLVNLYGQVVGINSSKIVSENYENMSFAIPISQAKAVLDQLMNGGYVQGRVRLGVTGADVADTQYVMMGAPLGFMIYEINEDSSFADTDAQPGDIITAVNGVEVSNLVDVSNELLKYAPGDTVTVTLYRMEGNVQDFDVEITLLEDQGQTQK